MKLARRITDVEPFLAVEIGNRAAALERTGVDVVHLEFGEPDFEAPALIQDAMARALKDGRARYTHSLGIAPLREAIVEHYARAYGVALSPAQVLVTPGTSPAMMLLFGALLDPGDEVVLGDPHYACYPNFIRYADGRPVYADAPEEDGFQCRLDAIADRLGPRTRAILINSPANPTGVVMSSELLKAIAELASDGGPMIVSDEIYHGLSGGSRDRSILEFTDRAFVLNGFSKAYAMTGWRLGYLIGPEDHIQALQRLAGNFFISTNEFVQWAGVAALREARGEPARFGAILAERRRVMIDGVKQLGFGVSVEPTGAFYVLANARAFSGDSVAFAFEILEGAHVAVTPGAAFGRNAEGFLRFSYAASTDRIREGLRRLGQFLRGRR